MPTKRQILETLTLTELQDLASRFELLVGDRRVRENLVQSAGLANRVALDQVLGGLPRERLKEICRELGLPDHGKEKASIVARILGREPEQGSFKLALSDSASPPPSHAEPAKAIKSPPSQKTPKPTPRGDSGSDLGFESKLWQAADKLRNNMDAAEYKHVVLGLSPPSARASPSTGQCAKEPAPRSRCW